MKKLLLLLLIITTHSPAFAEDFFEPKNAVKGFLVGSASTALCAGVYYWAQKSIVDKNSLNGTCAFANIISPLVATIAAFSLVNDKKSKEETRNVAILVDLLGGLFLPTSNLQPSQVFICKIVGNCIAANARPTETKES